MRKPWTKKTKGVYIKGDPCELDQLGICHVGFATLSFSFLAPVLPKHVEESGPMCRLGVVDGRGDGERNEDEDTEEAEGLEGPYHDSTV